MRKKYVMMWGSIEIVRKKLIKIIILFVDMGKSVGDDITKKTDYFFRKNKIEQNNFVFEFTKFII
jgi:hypothetical protein